MWPFDRKERAARAAAAEQSPTKPTGHRMPTNRALVRMFTAGKSDRLTASWSTTPMTADEVIRRNQVVLVARSREQASNNDYAKGFLRSCRQNIAGPRGLNLQAQSKDPGGKLDTAANDAIESAFRLWGKAAICDVAGRKSWRAIQHACVTSAAKDGEFMVRKVYGRDAGPWGFALQVLDPQRCPVHFDQDDLPGGRFIRHGIEFGPYGRPLAYYFTTTREADVDYSWGGQSFQRIPAGEIIHGFVEDIVGQKRGLPWMATALWRLRMLGGFEEAALVNARASAAKMGTLEWKEGYGPEPDDDEEIIIDGEAGSWQELPPGLTANKQDWNWPAGEMAQFSKLMLRGAATGLGVAYNNFANDLEGVNFSSIRSGTLEEREHWKDLQEWLIESLAEPVFQEWLPRALLAGRIKLANGGTLRPEKLEKYQDVTWQGRRWQWVDPRADVDAAVTSKNNLLASPGQLIRESGRDPETVWREIARDIQAMKDAGISDQFIQAAIGLKMGGAPNAQQQPEDAGDAA
jgi:lambda family phage portal protein